MPRTNPPSEEDTRLKLVFGADFGDRDLVDEVATEDGDLLGGRELAAGLGGHGLSFIRCALTRRTDLGRPAGEEGQPAEPGAALRLHVEGVSLRKIGRALVEAGHRPRRGGEWNPNTLVQLTRQTRWRCRDGPVSPAV